MTVRKGQTHKLIRVLRTLSKNEIQEFKQYLSSGLEKVPLQTRQLFTWMQRYTAKMDDPEAIRQYLSDKEEVTTKQSLDTLSRRLQSELYEALKNYLTYKHFKKDQEYQDISLLKCLTDRHLDGLFEKEWKRIQKKRETPNLLTAATVLNQIHLQQIYIDHHAIIEGKNSVHEAHEVLSSNIEDYYLLLHLKYGIYRWSKIDVLNNKNASPQHIGLPLFTPNHEVFFSSKAPLIQLYYYLFLLFTAADSAIWYAKIITLLQTHTAQLPFDDKRHAYTCALNYCAKQVGRGRQPFIKKAFDTYHKMFAEKIVYTKEGYFHAAHFSNFIKLAARLGKINHIKRLVELTKKDIPSVHQENTYQFYGASILFAEKKYGEVEQALKKIYERKNKKAPIADFYYDIEGRLLRIQALYELRADQLEALETALLAFKQYLQEDATIGAEKQLAYKNFILLTKQLATKYVLETENRVQKKQKRVPTKKTLLAHIHRTTPLAKKQWLLDKLDAFLI